MNYRNKPKKDLRAGGSQVLTKDSESTIEIELVNSWRPWITKNEIQASPQLYLAFVTIISTMSIFSTRVVAQTLQHLYLSFASNEYCNIHFLIAHPTHNTGHGVL